MFGLKCLSFPTICTPLPSRVELNDYPHLHDLEIGDDYDTDEHGAIDILIGVDYYWDFFVLLKHKTSQNEPKRPTTTHNDPQRATKRTKTS